MEETAKFANNFDKFFERLQTKGGLCTYTMSMLHLFVHNQWLEENMMGYLIVLNKGKGSRI